MDQLAKPIGLLMRSTFTVDLQDSLELSARKLRDNGMDILPVTEDGYLSGVITETSLASALAAGMELTDPVEAISRGALTSKPAMTGAEALRLFETQQASALVVIDDAGRVLGVLTPSDLYPKRITPPRPALVGGMATPFGVYLTTGSLRAGVSHLALVTTGATLFGLLLVASIITSLVTNWFTSLGLRGDINGAIQNVLPFALFLIGMRSIPLSGIHAAEHKVVHAIERGEELVPSIVRRMPRVHPRCGTNLATGAAIFTTLGMWQVIPDDYMELRLLFAAVMTLIFWRPLGGIMQYYVTTRPPTEKQLAMGIRSGRELLERYATQGSVSASFFQRIVNSGMLHVIAGSSLASAIVIPTLRLLHVPLDF